MRTMGVALLLAAAVAAQDTVRRSDASGRVSVEIPKEWDLKNYDSERAMLGLRGDVPGLGYVWVGVYLLQGSRDPLAQAWSEHDVRVLERETRSAEVEAATPPRMVFHTESLGEKRVQALAYHMVRRNGVSVWLMCSEDAWPRVKDVFPAIGASLRLEIDEWPPHPPDYGRSVVDDCTWYVQPGVDAADVGDLRSHCRSIRRRFEKVHGKVRVDPENPPVVVVCRSLGDVRGLYDGAKDDRYGPALDARGGRLFLTPLPKEEGPVHADAAECAWGLFLIAKYGAAWPNWMLRGEGAVAWSEEYTGKRLPFVNEDLRKRLPPAPPTFARLLEMEAAAVWEDPYGGLARAYVLLFRAGPSKYRGAYKAFLEDYAATKDANGAVRRHLGALDQERMREDLERWIPKSVKVAKPR